MKLWMEECQNEELSSLQRWEKSDDWFSNYEAAFQTEYQSENPFMKKITPTKSYAEAVKHEQRPRYRQSQPIGKRTNAEINYRRNNFQVRNRSRSNKRSGPFFRRNTSINRNNRPHQYEQVEIYGDPRTYRNNNISRQPNRNFRANFDTDTRISENKNQQNRLQDNYGN